MVCSGDSSFVDPVTSRDIVDCVAVLLFELQLVRHFPTVTSVILKLCYIRHLTTVTQRLQTGN